MQDPGNLPACVLLEIYGPVHVLHFIVQHFDEDILYLLYCIHHFPDEIQETFLYRKYILFKVSYSSLIQTYDTLGDDFPHLKVLLPAALVLTCIVQSGWTAWELTWSYSLWLESLAFIP